LIYASLFLANVSVVARVSLICSPAKGVLVLRFSSTSSP